MSLISLAFLVADSTLCLVIHPDGQIVGFSVTLCHSVLLILHPYDAKFSQWEIPEGFLWVLLTVKEAHKLKGPSHRGTNPMSNITWMFQIKELTLKGRPHVSLVQLHVKYTLIGSILSQFIHFLWILWILIMIIITWCSKKYFKLYIQLNISLFNCYISGPNRHQSDHRLRWASSQLDKNKNNSTLTQRQSFILRAATAQLYLSATLLIHHVSLSVTPSVLSNLLTIQLTKAAVASARHPNDFQPRQRPLIISPQEQGLVPGLLFCLKRRRQAGRLHTRQKKLSFQPETLSDQETTDKATTAKQTMAFGKAL